MSDRVLLDLIPFFEHLEKVDDVYSFLGNDNLPSSTTMYVGAVPPPPPIHHAAITAEEAEAPIFSSSVQSPGEEVTLDVDGS